MAPVQIQQPFSSIVYLLYHGSLLIRAESLHEYVELDLGRVHVRVQGDEVMVDRVHEEPTLVQHVPDCERIVLASEDVDVKPSTYPIPALTVQPRLQVQTPVYNGTQRVSSGSGDKVCGV